MVHRNTAILGFAVAKFEIIIPTDLIHLIGIAAPVETIYRAIPTEEGIRASA
ncbi:MAG: hypothetical protein ACLPRE_00110 [Limisphaerales bacterium]